MSNFRGSFEELSRVVAQTGQNGSSADIANGRQFRADQGAVLNWYPGTGTLQFQGPQGPRDNLREQVLRALGQSTERPAADETPVAVGEASSAGERVFVVHGHDATAREQLELILHKLGLDPFVLANTAGGGLTIIEALENEIGPGPNRVRFGIVLMTPDDVGYAKKDGVEKAAPRARQNVVLEMGMLIAALGRPNVAILRKGYVDVPSDAQGILYLPFNEHVRETVPKLVDRLRSAGFQLEPDQITRASA